MTKSELWPSTGPCRLCGAVGALCRSHITPKFVGDWLRKTNATGRMRGSDAPNKLVEDGAWRYLLCAKCEAAFNRFETQICEDIFLPLHEGTQQRFRYGASFCRFAVSVAWRWLVVLREEEHLSHLTEIPERVTAAEAAWREFLLGNRSTPSPHDVHVLPLDVPVEGDLEGVSPHFSRFLLRSESVSTMCRDGYGYVIVKMARLLVVATVEAGSERTVWKATKLHASGGSFGVDNYRVPGWVFDYLKHSALKQEELVNGLSLRQKRRTKEDLLKAIRSDPDAYVNSDNFRAFEADLKLFGKRAFQRPFPETDEPDQR